MTVQQISSVPSSTDSFPGQFHIGRFRVASYSIRTSCFKINVQNLSHVAAYSHLLLLLSATAGNVQETFDEKRLSPDQCGKNNNGVSFAQQDGFSFHRVQQYVVQGNDIILPDVLIDILPAGAFSHPIKKTRHAFSGNERKSFRKIHATFKRNEKTNNNTPFTCANLLSGKGSGFLLLSRRGERHSISVIRTARGQLCFRSFQFSRSLWNKRPRAACKRGASCPFQVLREFRWRRCRPVRG